ncbi:MAG TPA: efflux RND transporter periplasmic adaptor subunit [Calditrichia bacterium]|nr:efflux RND transporter periplasmic adaptor subunit [Calditrichota bacterium]HQU73788.1 efflux RND transporter periplasmic adaptor subunit [Calditrichia bacterium]HQV31660.1 efflux RND transporter periplasmic adaptor subunit [Calditrichia bacterium]
MDRIIEKQKASPARLAAITLAGFAGLFLLYRLIWGEHLSEADIKRDSLIISEVHQGNFQENIPLTGTVIPLTTVYLDAVEGGRVEERYVEAGTMVREGDPILRLGNTNLLLDIMFREAELFDAANNLRNTRLAMEQNSLDLQGQLLELNYQIRQLERRFRRSESLIDEDLISREAHEDLGDELQYLTRKRKLAIQSFRQDSLFRTIQVNQLEASLKRMENNLSLARGKLDNLTISAPISGQLTSLNAEIGESKPQGERLGQVDVLDGFKVRASVDEYYLSRIATGQEGFFSLNDAEYRLVIDKIYPEILNNQFDVEMRFLQHAPDGLRRGQSVVVELRLGEREKALWVARGSFYQDTGGRWVYVLDPSGNSATRREVRLGRQNPGQFEILEGLVPGEKVITSSYVNFDRADKINLN